MQQTNEFLQHSQRRSYLLSHKIISKAGDLYAMQTQGYVKILKGNKCSLENKIKIYKLMKS